MAFGSRAASGRPASHGELEAVHRVTALFALEALLALDAYERSIPAEDPARPRKIAEQLGHWWKELGLDETSLGDNPTDAERILATAGRLAVDRKNEFGVTIQEATTLARTKSIGGDLAALTKGIEDFRREQTDSYGARGLPTPEPAVWLRQSLTRLARATVLRDVVELGAKAKMSRPVRDAANDLIYQGQRLIKEQRRVADERKGPVPGRRRFALQQAGYISSAAAWSIWTGTIPAPGWAHAAVQAPAAIYLAYQCWRAAADRDAVIDARLGSVQAGLRTVRSDLVKSVEQSAKPGMRDAWTLRAARGRNGGPGR